MKKIIKSTLLLLCSVCLFTACSDDNDANPVIQKPTGFVLNTPALSEQYIQLAAGNKVNLTWSQPNYGFNTVANYKVQVGVCENGTIKWNTEEDGSPKYLESTYTTCNVNISGEEIAQAICKIDGVTSEDDYVDKGFREIAMRVYASIEKNGADEVANTGIVSNTVTFKHMAAYYAIKGKAYIYIVGNCTGPWTEPSENNAEFYAAWRVYETEIGSNLFEGTFDMPSGDLQFRFYTKLTGWDNDSMGPQVDDAGVDSEFTDGVFSGEFDKGKGTWLFHDFAGGSVKVTVDMTLKKVKFELQ